MDKKKIYAIILVAVIAVAILVPVLLLMRPGGEPTPLGITILSPTSTTYTSETTEITVDLSGQGADVDAIWYRIYNETDGAWVDPANISWTASTARLLGKGGVYNLYAWVNDTLGTTIMTNVSFTMIQEFPIEGDTVFADTWTVGEYEKYILRHGDFSHSSGGYIYVDGILEMENCTWTTDLRIDANSKVTVTDVIFEGQLNLEGDIVATLENVTVLDNINIQENAIVTLTNATVVDLYFDENCQVNVSYVTGYRLYGYGNAIVTLRNYTQTGDLQCFGNPVFTLINCELDDIMVYSQLDAGSWVVDQNTLSGTGTRFWATVSLINTIYDNFNRNLNVYGSTEVLINNSDKFYVIHGMASSNLTIENTSMYSLRLDSTSSASVVSSTATTLEIATNSTLYLEDISFTSLIKIIAFDAGTISGYNETFTGMETWRIPKITEGPGVNYVYFLYSYDVNIDANLTLRDTPNCHRVTFYDDSTGSLLRCEVDYFYANQNAMLNGTLINTTILWGYGYSYSNVTLSNCSVTGAYNLADYAYASFIDGCWVAQLNLFGSSDYFVSGDSTIVSGG